MQKKLQIVVTIKKNILHCSSRIIFVELNKAKLITYIDMHTNYRNIQTFLSQKNITLVVVTKTRSVEDILQLYNAGHRDFGENRVQELNGKFEQLPKDIRWHIIGHLQKNKVKYVAPYIHLIHSVDTAGLLTEINKHGEKNNRIIDCLMQMHIASEETKFGLDENELMQILESGYYKKLKYMHIKGLMAMATNTGDAEKVRSEFQHLYKIFLRVKEKYFSADAQFKEISMGMSSDYKIAIEEGATMVRIGSLIFKN